MKQRDPDFDFGFYANIPRKIRTEYKDLTPVQKWLYVCLKDLCGESGTCFRTVKVLSQETDISTGMISESIPLLQEAQLIHAEKKSRSTGGKAVWHITITDIWASNGKLHPTKRSHSEQTLENVHTVNNNIHTVNDNTDKRSQDELERSHSETEERSLSNITIEERSIEEEGVGSGEPTAPANVYHLEEKRQRRGDTDPRMKAVKIGDTNDLTDYANSDQHSNNHHLRGGRNHPDREMQIEGKVNHDTPDHSTDSTLPDSVSRAIADNTVRAQEMGQSELDTSLPSLGTPAPAQRSESLSPNAAVQGANQEKRKSKQDKPAIEPEVMAVIERWSQAMKKTYPMTDTLIKAATLLAPCQPSAEDLKKVRAFCFKSNPKWFRDERKGAVTLMDVAKNWEAWQSSLETSAPADSEQDSTLGQYYYFTEAM